MKPSQPLFVILLCHIYLSYESVQPCVKDLRYHPNLIIDVKQSLNFGANFLVKLAVRSLKDCFFACCNTTSCTDALYKSKVPHVCFLFSCISTNTCVYAAHDHYDVFTTSVLHGQQRKTAVGLGQHCNVEKTCATNNSICSDGLCACSSGWTQKSDRCVLSVCRLPDAQFQCDDSSACVAIYNRCNGIMDCSDGSDENGCSADSQTSGVSEDQHSKSYKDTESLFPWVVNKTNFRSHRSLPIPVTGQKFARLDKNNKRFLSTDAPIISSVAGMSSSKLFYDLPDPEMDFYSRRPYQSNGFAPHHRYYPTSWSTVLDNVEEQDLPDILPPFSRMAVLTGLDSSYPRKFQSNQDSRPTFFVSPLSHDSISPEHHTLLHKSPRDDLRMTQHVTDFDQRGLDRQRWGSLKPLYDFNPPQSAYYRKRIGKADTEHPYDDDQYLSPAYQQASLSQLHDTPTHFVDRPLPNSLRSKSAWLTAKTEHHRYDHLPTMESGGPSGRLSKHEASKDSSSIQDDNQFVIEDSHQSSFLESANPKAKASDMAVATALSRSQSEGHTAALILTFSLGLLCCFVGFLIAEWWRRRRRRPYIHRSYYSLSNKNDTHTFHRPKRLSNTCLTPPGTQFKLFSRGSASVRHPVRAGVLNDGTDQPEETNALCENLAL